MFSRSLAVFQQRAGTSFQNKAAKKILSVVPSMQVYTSKPDGQGTMTRFTADARGLRMGVVPQIPAADDSQELTPQFDGSGRAICTFVPHEAASVLAVLQGKAPSTVVDSEYRKVTFEPTTPSAGSKKAFKFSGTLKRADQREVPVDLVLEKGSLATFQSFLESSIDEGFGFAQFMNTPKKLVIAEHEAAQRKAMQNNNNNNRQRDNNNKNGNNNKNNNGNNNGNNNKNGNNNNRSGNNTNSANRNRNRNNNNSKDGNKQQQDKPKVDDATKAANEKKAEQMATEDFI